MATRKANPQPAAQDRMEQRMAEGLKQRREYLGLSTTDVADRSGVSRAMVSKIERLDVSPTAALLGRLCNGLGISLSSLIAGAEGATSPPIARRSEQPVWRDPETGLRRTMVSPLNTGARTEIVRIELPSGANVVYEPQRHAEFDQHVVVLQGTLTVTVDGETRELAVGDCVHMRLDTGNSFANRSRGACKYLVVITH